MMIGEKVVFGASNAGAEVLKAESGTGAPSIIRVDAFKCMLGVRTVVAYDKPPDTAQSIATIANAVILKTNGQIQHHEVLHHL